MSQNPEQAEDLISQLNLQPHPEGGWYRETYRSPERIPASALPERFGADHCYCTSIYYLLRNRDFSAFHRIQSDETWHFYLGSPVKLYILQNNNLQTILLGDNPAYGHTFQFTIPYGCWFAAEVSVPESFALMGCTVSPGFEFGDFQMASLSELQEHYGRYATLIRRMTRM